MAMEHDLTFVPRNTRDFRSDAGMEILIPYQS